MKVILQFQLFCKASMLKKYIEAFFIILLKNGSFICRYYLSRANGAQHTQRASCDNPQFSLAIIPFMVIRLLTLLTQQPCDCGYLNTRNNRFLCEIR